MPFLSIYSDIWLKWKFYNNIFIYIHYWYANPKKRAGMANLLYFPIIEIGIY